MLKEFKLHSKYVFLGGQVEGYPNDELFYYLRGSETLNNLYEITLKINKIITNFSYENIIDKGSNNTSYNYNSIKLINDVGKCGECGEKKNLFMCKFIEEYKNLMKNYHFFYLNFYKLKYFYGINNKLNNSILIFLEGLFEIFIKPRLYFANEDQKYIDEIQLLISLKIETPLDILHNRYNFSKDDVFKHLLYEFYNLSINLYCDADNNLTKFILGLMKDIKDNNSLNNLLIEINKFFLIENNPIIIFSDSKLTDIEISNIISKKQITDVNISSSEEKKLPIIDNLSIFLNTVNSTLYNTYLPFKNNINDNLYIFPTNNVYIYNKNECTNDNDVLCNLFITLSDKANFYIYTNSNYNISMDVLFNNNIKIYPYKLFDHQFIELYFEKNKKNNFDLSKNYNNISIKNMIKFEIVKYIDNNKNTG